MIEGVLEKDFRIVIVDETQFGIMSEKRTNDMFIPRRLQEDHHAKGKN